MKRLRTFGETFLITIIAGVVLSGICWGGYNAIMWSASQISEHGPQILSWFLGLPGWVQILCALIVLAFCFAFAAAFNHDAEYAEAPDQLMATTLGDDGELIPVVEKRKNSVDRISQ